MLLSNRYGKRPVRIANATAGIVGVPSGLALRFGNSPQVTLPPGADVASAPLPIRVQAGQDLMITLSFEVEPVIESFHFDGRSTARISDGGTTTSRLFLSGVLVERKRGCGTVVALGDSLTDGNGTEMDSETRWTDLFAKRAAAREIAIVNAGISGARLLTGGMGSNALARLAADVFAQSNVRILIIQLGTNDIAWPGSPFASTEPPMTYARLTDGYRLLVERARASGMRVFVVTIPPFRGALPGTPMARTYFSPTKDALRVHVNDWLRSSSKFDGVIDFDRVLRDPEIPARLLPAYDSGDHLHPGAAGNAAMADAIDLTALVPGGCEQSGSRLGEFP